MVVQLSCSIHLTLALVSRVSCFVQHSGNLPDTMKLHINSRFGMINETDFTNTVIMLQIEVSVLDSCMDFIR
jgi:hypothetical protein